MAEENKALAVKKDIGQQVIDRIDKLCEVGFTMPRDFNYINAIKSSMLALQEVKDKDGKAALEVCTPTSVQRFLFDMATKGLDVSKKQMYPIVRGNKLCGHVSYFGNILMVKRLYPDWFPVARTIREGDEFVYTIDPVTAKMKLVKHEQKLENLDNEFVGAYVYMPCADGENELYIMTRKQILKAWSKSSSKTLQTHKDFDEKMAIRTVINSGCTKVINATPDPTNLPPDDDDMEETTEEVANSDTDFTTFEEVNDDNSQPNDASPLPKDDNPAHATAEQHDNNENNDDF